MLRELFGRFGSRAEIPRAGVFPNSPVRVAAITIMLCCSILLGGCGSTPVAQDLTQMQANEIVAILTGQGISAIAKKETGGKGLYTVQIRDEHYGAAVTLLNERGLPSETKPTVGELLSPHGLIPSSREMEALRLDYALGTQIEEMLQSYPGVARARCVVRLNFLKEGQNAAVSVVIETRPQAAPITAETVSELVQHAVPGILRENITVALAADSRVKAGSGAVEAIENSAGGARKVPLVKFLWLWRVPENEYAGLALLFSGALLLVGMVAAGLGYWTCLFQRTREPVETNVPEVFPKSLRLDRIRKDLPE